MKLIKEINLNWLTISGFAVLVSIIFFGGWLLINTFVPVTNSDVLTVSSYKEMTAERYNYEDSIREINQKIYLDSLTKLNLVKHEIDSVINNFYTIKNSYYEEKLNNASNLTVNEIISDWERRYKK